MIQAVNLQLQELQLVISELETLTSKASLSKVEEARHSFLLAKFALLKQGVSAQEFNRSRVDALRKELGLPEGSVPKASRADVEQWRTACLAQKPNGEVRTIQTNADFGRVSGETYDAPTQGSTLVPASYDARLFQSLGQHDEIIEEKYSNVFYSDLGSAAATPAVDDWGTSSPAVLNKSTIVDETVQTSLAAVRFGSVQWGKLPTFRTGRVLVGVELEQDCFESVVSVLEMTFQRRHALGVGDKFINGQGPMVNEPQGLLSVLPSSTVVTTASNLAITLADLIKVYKKLPPVYRRDAVWYMHSDTQADFVAALLETNNRALIGDDLAFLRKPIAVCNSMPTVSAGQASVVVLANPNYLLQRRIKGDAFIRRSKEYSGAIEYGLIAYESFLRTSFAPMLFDSPFPPVASLNVKS